MYALSFRGYAKYVKCQFCFLLQGEKEDELHERFVNLITDDDGVDKVINMVIITSVFSFILTFYLF